MKKTLLTLSLALSLISTIGAQDFSTKFYIENKSGRKDSIELGYASDATFGIDPKYNETQITNPLSTNNLQVLIGINNTTSTLSSLIRDKKLDTYSKKQIVPIQAGYIEMNAVPILIPTDSLPLTIRWDKSLFNNNQRDHSLITDWNIGGWFDAGYRSVLEYMKDTNSVQVTQSIETYQITNNNKTQQFTLLYIAFGNWTNVLDGTTSVHQSKDISIHISNRTLTINNQSECTISDIKLLSITGSIVGQWNYSGQWLDMSQFPKGIYILNMTTPKGLHTFKISLN